jgi:hypothetical protein
MTVPAIGQPPKSGSASNHVRDSIPASPEPSVTPEPLLTMLLENEDTAAYEQMFTRISAVVKPADFLEEIWVRDVVALVWEAFRLRRLKTCLMETAAPDGLAKVLSSFLPRTAVNEMVAGWAGRDSERIRQVEELLDQSGFTMEHVIAETLAERIEDIERIDRMIVSTEQRRSAMLREVDRHRASLASRLRLASDEVVQAEFEDVTPDLATPRRRAQ